MVTKVIGIRGIGFGCNVRQSLALTLCRNKFQRAIIDQYYLLSSTVGQTITSLEDNYTPDESWLLI